MVQIPACIDEDPCQRNPLIGPMISTIIPLYNEEENIDELHKQLKSVLESMDRKHEIIYIDDGSTDGTCRKLLALRSRDDSLKIVKFRKNFGQTAAMHAGFDYASGDIVITMDGDLQNDPKDIPEMVKKLEEEDYDVVCGWRFKRKDTIPKKVVSKFANFLRRNLTGEEIHDSGCTLRAYKIGCIKGLDLYGEMHRYIPAILTWKGYKVGEMKVSHHERRRGKTKYNWRRLTRGGLDLLVIAFWQKYSFKPVHVFGMLGIGMSGLGIAIGAYLAAERLLLGTSLANRPLFIASIMMIVMGIQFITLGILADIMLKIYFGQNERKSYLVERVID